MYQLNKNCGSSRIRITAWLAVFAATLSGATAHAATMSYTLSMSNDLGWILDPTSQMAQMAAKNKTAAVIASQYNNPILELTNTSVSADISDLMLTVNEPKTVINALKILQGPPGAVAAGQFATSVWGSPTKMIEIKLPTPLAPDASLLFALNLAPGAGFTDTWIPNFVNDLWSSAGGTNFNATLAVTYIDPTNNNAATVSRLQLTNDRTQMDIQTLMSTCCNSNTAASTLLSDTIGGPEVVTPEPASVVLTILGSFPVAIGVWRSRKKNVNARKAPAIA